MRGSKLVEKFESKSYRKINAKNNFLMSHKPSFSFYQFSASK